MKKVRALLIVMLFFVASTNVSFAWDKNLYVPQASYDFAFKFDKYSGAEFFRLSLPSEMFVDVICAVFSNKNEVKITDVKGKDVTDFFFARYEKLFSEGKYLPIWKYTKKNVQSIFWEESFSASDESTVIIRGSDYYIDRNVKYGATHKLLEMIANVEGYYVVDSHTGKLLSADITGVWVDTDLIGAMWDFRISGCYFNVILSRNSALFIASNAYDVYGGFDRKLCGSGNLSTEFVVSSK